MFQKSLQLKLPYSGKKKIKISNHREFVKLQRAIAAAQYLRHYSNIIKGEKIMIKQDLYLTPHPKTHSKWIKELNVKTLHTKNTRRKHGGMFLYNLSRDKDSLKIT